MPERPLRHRDVQPISRNQARATFRSGDEAAIMAALLGLALHDPDWRWVQEQCLHYAKHRSGAIRGQAALCFGHLARIHRALDLKVVVPVLRALANNPETRGQADNALSDIAIFIPKT